VPFFKYKQHIFHVNFNYATSLINIKKIGRNSKEQAKLTATTQQSKIAVVKDISEADNI